MAVLQTFLRTVSPVRCSLRLVSRSAPLSCHVVKSKLPDVQIPEHSSFTQFVFQHFDQYQDRTALVNAATGDSCTYQQLRTDVRKVGSALTRLGLKKGDVFAIFSPNIPEFVIMFHGVASIGGVVTTVNPLSTTYEIARQLKLTQAKFLITIPPLADRARQAAQEVGIEHLYVIGESQGYSSYDSLLDNDATDFPDHVTFQPKEDLIALPCSSGTTGLPKAVMLTHHNLVSNVVQSTADRLLDEPSGTSIMALLPLYHIYGLLFFNGGSLYRGHKVVLLPQFLPELFLRSVQEHKISMAPIVPPIALFLAKDPLVEQYDVSSLNELMCGAAPLGKEISVELKEKLPNVTLIRQGYGLTETSPATHIDVKDDPKDGSVGVIVPNTECKVVDVSTGEALGPNERGELCVRGPQVMKGYLNNPTETAHALDEHGWFRTGDISYYDEDGHFFVVDRVKELIKYKGLQVAPAEIEDLLLSHPSIKDAAVIGIPSEEAGEVPKAFVVRSGEVTKDDVMEFVAEKVSPYKKLRGGVEFVEAIPKAASGKILRRVLKEQEIEKAKAK